MFAMHIEGGKLKPELITLRSLYS